ncbi:MAG: superoxide dismutase family protein, partial [Betaproteobacteria bacterium]
MSPARETVAWRNVCRTGLLTGAGMLLLASCQTHNGPTIYDDPSAMAVLSPTSGSSVHGVVTFVRKNNGTTLVTANLSGFKPNSAHGMHIHEQGNCA